jgi:hypothetical protein
VPTLFSPCARLLQRSASASVLAEVVCDEAAASMRAPFAFGDREGPRDLLAEAASPT